MKPVFIVPTGIGAEIGGHAGDAMPAANLIASVSDIMITHPNVYNASDINEMPGNALYVEGSMLDRFLEGQHGLKRVRSNKILVVVNVPVQSETINAVSAGRATIGLDAEILELNTPLKMIAGMDNGKASGVVNGWKELIEQVKSYDYDALAIATEIECDEGLALEYLRSNEGVNPWGAVEALASRMIADSLNKPVAHAPVELGPLKTFKEVVEPRKSAEIISVAYLHCVLKGLHKAPQIGSEIISDDVDCLITPSGCFGRPHRAFINMKKPIIIIKENTTVDRIEIDYNKCIYVENYLEAVGVIIAMKNGISIESVTRPLYNTSIITNA